MKAVRPVVMGLAAGLIGAASTSQFIARRAPLVASESPRAVAVASIASRDTAGSVWFCPLVASTDDNSAAALRISRALPRRQRQGQGQGQKEPNPASLRITLYGPAGEIAASTVELTSGSIQVSVSSLLRSADTATLPSISATIESTDPFVLVEANLGASSSGFVPCATTVSPRWFIPVGSTQLQHTTELALFNPFPGTALVDLQFWSERGADRPTALQGVAVPGGSLRIIELGDSVRRRERLATEVSVRSGRVVAATSHRFGGHSELSVGIPGLASELFVPAAQWSAERPESFTFVNPGAEDATLELTVTLTPDDVEPFELVVPAGATAVFNPQADGRVPTDTPYAVVVHVSGGPDVAMSRGVVPSTGARRHFSQPAAGLTASAWVAPVADGASFTVFNPYDVAASVTVSSMGAEGKAVAIAAGGFRTVTVTDAQREGATLIVSASGAPVVVSVLTEAGTDVLAVPMTER